MTMIGPPGVGDTGLSDDVIKKRYQLTRFEREKPILSALALILDAIKNTKTHYPPNCRAGNVDDDVGDAMIRDLATAYEKYSGDRAGHSKEAVFSKLVNIAFIACDGPMANKKDRIKRIKIALGRGE